MRAYPFDPANPRVLGAPRQGFIQGDCWQMIMTNAGDILLSGSLQTIRVDSTFRVIDYTNPIDTPITWISYNRITDMVYVVSRSFLLFNTLGCVCGVWCVLYV